MQVKLLKDIVSEIAGEVAEKIVDLLYGKKNVNEFLIAKKLDLTINQTRNILYKLADVGLVGFVRKKDSKKGGWYTYFWTLNSGKAIELLRNRVFSKLEEFEKEIGRRKKERFYYCPDADIEYTEEEALENDFICPETGCVLELKDNADLIKGIEKEASVLKGILNSANEQLEIIEKKGQKAKNRKFKAEEKKKAEERAIRRKKLALERKKLAKPKTIVKKKKKVKPERKKVKSGQRKKVKLKKKAVKKLMAKPKLKKKLGMFGLAMRAVSGGRR